ncbi:hypothetical protein CR513_10227, partial [Mucuna pruriens]
MENIMVDSATKVSLVLLVTLVVIISCLETCINEFNNFLKAQTEEAYKIALDTYVPTPKDVTNELNFHGVEEASPVDNTFQLRTYTIIEMPRVIKAAKSTFDQKPRGETQGSPPYSMKRRRKERIRKKEVVSLYDNNNTLGNKLEMTEKTLTSLMPTCESH